MSVNFWLEPVIDAYLLAISRGDDWQTACAEACKANNGRPLSVLTQRDLRGKGIRYSRQHLARLIAAKAFPAPFKMT